VSPSRLGRPGLRQWLKGGVLRRDAGAGLAVVIGAMLLRLSLSDIYQRYVKVSSRWELISAGAVLIALGAIDLLRGRRSGRQHGASGRDHRGAPADHDHRGVSADHDHSAHVPAAAVLLLLPVVAVFLVAPPSLGTYAAARAARVARSDLRPATSLPPAVDGAVPLTIGDFDDRASFGQDLTVGRYRLIGFVMPSTAADQASFALTRMRISCCAADAQMVAVPVVGVGSVPKTGTWVEVIGSEVIGPTGGPQIEAFEMRRVASPSDPYE
jgi:uncharacterized repeat protein (TIGR03943 family)